MANILVVDDDPNVSRAIGDTLREAGHAVKLIDDASEAIKEICVGPVYDAVFVDWGLAFPGGFGAILLATIPRGERVIAMVGSNFNMPAELRCKLGGILFKPFSADGLMSALISLGLSGGD